MKKLMQQLMVVLNTNKADHKREEIKKLMELAEEVDKNANSSENFLTKKDLQGLATKKDLEGFLTKKDLENLATKKDLQGYMPKK